MIIKFLSRKSNSGQLLRYILRYILDDSKKRKAPVSSNQINTKDAFLIKHNIRSRTLKGFIREFNENESYRLVRRKDSVKVFHTIISFGTKDKSLITDKLLKDIAKRYIEERGSNCLYVGTKHEDKGHIHLHICSSGTQLNGRSARISNQKFRSITKSLNTYQKEKYPFLINSLPDYERTNSLSTEKLIETVKSSRQTNKAALIELLDEIFAQSHSLTEFLKHIRSLGHTPYLRIGKLQGLLYNGKTKYRFSRLGFSPEKLNELNNSPVRKTVLKEAHINDVVQDTKQNLRITKPKENPQKTELTKLAALRENSRLQEKETDIERTLSDTSREYESGTEDESPLFLPSPFKYISLPITDEL